MPNLPGPFFLGLKKEERQRVLASSRSLRLLADTRLFNQDDAASHFYVLLQGHLRQTQLSLDGQKVQLGELEPGDPLGLLSVFLGTRYPITVEAVLDSDLLSWEGRRLRELLEEIPRLAVNGLQIMSERFRLLQVRYREQLTERVEQRLARTLLRLAKQMGRKHPRGILIDLPLSRQDLAEMSGTTMSTVSRIISRWEETGLVESGRKRVVITHSRGLVSVAEDLAGICPAGALEVT